MFFEEKNLEWLRHRLLELQKLRLDLSALVDEAFLMDERKLMALQRFCMLQSRDKMLSDKLASLSNFMRIEWRTYISRRQFEPILFPAQEIKPPKDVIGTRL